MGLDLNDVDFKNNGITVTRKGGNQMVVYFGDEVADALLNPCHGALACLQAAWDFLKWPGV